MNSLSTNSHDPVEIFGNTPCDKNLEQIIYYHSLTQYMQQPPKQSGKGEEKFSEWQIREWLHKPQQNLFSNEIAQKHEKSPPVINKKEPIEEDQIHSKSHFSNPTNPHEQQNLIPALSKDLPATNREIFRLKAVFPFDFFPDEIKIKENKVIIIQRAFFGSGEIRSFDPQEISEVSLMDTPFFASMRFNVRSFANNVVVVKFLKKKDALFARSLIEGLSAMREHKVDISKMSIQEIKYKAMFLGGGKQSAS